MADPITHFAQWSPSGISPSGHRHQTSGTLYVKELSTDANEELNFGTLDITEGINTTSDTRCLVWIIDDLKDVKESIFDMKFWLSSVADFVGRGVDYQLWFNQHITSVWTSGLSINEASGVFTPISLPGSQNLLKWDGSSEIAVSGMDDAVSQYIYLSTTADKDTPVGIYGGATVGTFRYRVTYKYI